MSAIALECRPVSESPQEPRYQRVADTLRDLRVSAGITQEELARRVNLTLSGYRTYEQGKRDLKAEQIEIFAAALGKPISAITSRLWPDDEILVETHYSADFTELKRQVSHLPLRKQERILRSFWASVEIAQETDEDTEDLARG